MMVLGLVGLTVAGLSYTITDVLPKLQKEKTKVEATINYKVFMSSLNDYLLHALRERWCFNVSNGNETDLLVSTRCGKDYPMEDIVTYPGNIERILWTANNIGATPVSMDAASRDNRILAINYIRYNSSPRQASRLLKFEDISPPGKKLTFKLTKNILTDMTDEHPLFMMAKPIRDCINSVDIELFQVTDTSNVQSGDERKVGITLTANIDLFKMKCHAAKTVTSTSYYTYYPRRLHTFALMKYGDLDGTYKNEFHGPVYVAGDFVLPPQDFAPERGSVFYSTLTLGVFNGGNDFGGKYKAGKILTSDRQPYTFQDRGHPYLSKQDSYKGFRGFRGGVRLDATEDKGFYNLFSYNNTSAANMDILKECIEEAKYQTTPSLNEKSVLGYSQYQNTGSSASMKVAFNERNRFKGNGYPSAFTETEEDPKNPGKGRAKRGMDLEPKKEKELLFNVPAAPNGSLAYGEITITPGGQTFELGRDNHMGATIGGGSSVEVIFNYNAFDLTKEKISEFMANANNSTRSTYRMIVDPNHVLAQANPVRAFLKKADDLKDKCDHKTAEECHFFGYNEVECGRDLPGKPYCNYSDEVNDYKKAHLELKSYLEKVKNMIESSDTPKMTIAMANQYNNDKLILNFKTLNFTFTENWKFFFPILKQRISGLRINFSFYNYARSNRGLSLNLESDSGKDLEFAPQGFALIPDKQLYSGWRKASDNKSFYPEPKPIEELDCPNGMGLADWDLDMSGSSAFAWNYANTPSGAIVDTNDHENLNEITFSKDLIEGHKSSTSKSVVDECIIPADRDYVYGFYVCKKLVIKERKSPLWLIGTFIVKDIDQPKSNVPIYWHSIWDTKAADLVMNDLNKDNSVCSTSKVTSKTFNDLMKDDQLKARMIACSSLDLVNNGPNNFTWTTVDPDIGIAKPGDTMTSQKANRIQKWVIKEESRVEVIR